MSADTMLQALLGSKHKVSLDLRANLKQVKKEVKEEVSAHYGNTETILAKVIISNIIFNLEILSWIILG